jgi:hypothetical protein
MLSASPRRNPACSTNPGRRFWLTGIAFISMSTTAAGIQTRPGLFFPLPKMPWRMPWCSLGNLRRMRGGTGAPFSSPMTWETKFSVSGSIDRIGFAHRKTFLARQRRSPACTSSRQRKFKPHHEHRENGAKLGQKSGCVAYCDELQTVWTDDQAGQQPQFRPSDFLKLAAPDSSACCSSGDISGSKIRSTPFRPTMLGSDSVTPNL